MTIAVLFVPCFMKAHKGWRAAFHSLRHKSISQSKSTD